MSTYHRTRSRRKWNKRRYRSSTTRDYGHERALQHIADAKEFSNEIGGIDNEVKEYFFDLPESKLNKLLSVYGKKYGESAQEYAGKTIPRWKNGWVNMSGTVARRLFSLLPPIMPLEKKYSMVKSLWKNSCPKTKATFHIGPDVNAKDAAVHIARHLVKTVGNHFINIKFKREFKWLSQEDVELQEQLHNHFKVLHRDAVVKNMKQRLPMLREHFKADIVTRMSQTFTVLNHEITIEFSDDITGISRNADSTDRYQVEVPQAPAIPVAPTNSANTIARSTEATSSPRNPSVTTSRRPSAEPSFNWMKWWWVYLLILLWFFSG